MADDASLEFGGKCAFAVALGGLEKAPLASPACTLEVDGKTYAFTAAVPRWLFKTFGLAARAQTKAAQAK